MDDQTFEKIEQNIENMPTEVREFVFGDGLANVQTELDLHLIRPEDKDILSNALFAFLYGTGTRDELDNTIESFAIDADQKEAIRSIIQEKIIDELLLLMEVHNELEGGIEGDLRTEAAPPADLPGAEPATPKEVPQTPAVDPLASLKARMSAPAAIAPVKRDQSMMPSKPIEASPEKPAIDPYRELPLS